MNFEPLELIRQAINRHKDRICIACSFGKDSIVVLDMALQINPNIKVVFENTGVEFPETIELKNRLKVDWKLNLYETKPIKSFWKCVAEYGLPTVRNTKGKGSNSPKCCYYLKEKPFNILQKETGINAVITGLLACESRSRALLAMRFNNKKAPYNSFDNVPFCSQRWYARSTETWKYNPIMEWSEEQVWEDIRKNNLPINEVYTKWNGIYPRCGCLPCTAYKSWEERLSISHPKLYEKLKSIQTEGQDNG